MTDYELWKELVLDKAKAKENKNNVYEQCRIEEAIAMINGENINDIIIKNNYLRSQVDMDTELAENIFDKNFNKGDFLNEIQEKYGIKKSENNSPKHERYGDLLKEYQ